MISRIVGPRNLKKADSVNVIFAFGGRFSVMVVAATAV